MMEISIHALREEGDRAAIAYNVRYARISIHALREEGDPALWYTRRAYRISIHALREEGDSAALSAGRLGGNFYPRPPRGGRPRRAVPPALIGVFLSTPSARRATLLLVDDGKPCADFYPRPPRGGRQQKQRQNLYFQTNYTTFCTNLEEP